MVLGEDYDREDVVITDKKSEDATADNAISQNYFFYYHGGKTNEYNKRMQVPESVYAEYKVGDTITAYTTDHIKYSYNKAGILPDKKFRNNELMKVAGVLLGAAIGFPEFVGLIKQKDKLKNYDFRRNSKCYILCGMEKRNDMSKLEWTIKLIIIVVGSVVAAYGITLALYAGFGGATLAVLWRGISKTFHVSIGTASMIVAIVMIVFAFSMTGHRYISARYFYQIVYSFV